MNCISVRYKQQVSSGLQREQALEQKRVQLELDWERRCEEVRSEHYLRSEELIQSLTQARDQVSCCTVRHHKIQKYSEKNIQNNFTKIEN